MAQKIVKLNGSKKELILEDNRMIDLEIDVYSKRQHRILNYIKRKVNTEHYEGKVEQYEIIIKLNELYEYIGMKNKSKKEIEQDFIFLRDHSIKFIGRMIGMSWIATYSFDKLPGYVIVEITPMMKEYIYPKEYTKYLPETVKNFNCKYSYSIYPMLKKAHEINRQYNKKDLIVLDLELLYQKFTLGDNYKNDFGLFKKYILIPALEDLKETDLKIEEYNFIKTNGKTTSIEFKISTNHAKTYELKKERELKQKETPITILYQDTSNISTNSEKNDYSVIKDINNL
jgi:hypothetical protein